MQTPSGEEFETIRFISDDNLEKIYSPNVLNKL